MTPEEEALADRVEHALQGSDADLYIRASGGRAYLGRAGVTYEASHRLLLGGLTWNAFAALESRVGLDATHRFGIELELAHGSRFLYEGCRVMTTTTPRVGHEGDPNAVELSFEEVATLHD